MKQQSPNQIGDDKTKQQDGRTWSQSVKHQETDLETEERGRVA